MELKDFMNSKGLGMDVEIHVTHHRDNGIHTIKIADMIEEYYQKKLELSIITENKVKQELLNRGFTKKLLLNNRGLIGATIEETAISITKKT